MSSLASKKEIAAVARHHAVARASGRRQHGVKDDRSPVAELLLDGFHNAWNTQDRVRFDLKNVVVSLIS
jgi:hypothetical protein